MPTSSTKQGQGEAILSPSTATQAHNTSEELAQQTLDLQQLQPYFHEKEIPARSPLVVLLNEAINPSFTLTKFGKPVVLTPASSLAKNTPAFVFDSIDIKDSTARVEFRYPPEGIRGHVTFRRAGDSSWLVDQVSLAEN